MRLSLHAVILLSAVGLSARAAERPLAFVENFGQADARAELVARTRSGAAFVTREGVVLDVRGPSGSGAALRMRVVGGAPTCVEAEGELPSRVSYFRGADPLQWKRGLRTWSGARQRDVYPGIDLVYHGSEGALEHDFIVAPGADPAWIRVAWEGAQSVTAQSDGSLHIDTGRGVLVQRAPVAWEERGGIRRDVTVRQVVDARGEVGYEVGERDPSATLVIDPLVYSTFLGGSDADRAYDVEARADGTTWVASWTLSRDFPTTLGAYSETLEGTADVVVTKLTANGTLDWSTYLGGTRLVGELNEWDDLAIGVDSEDSVFVAGATLEGFPTTAGAFDTTFNSTPQNAPDGFVARLDATGSTLLFGTYVGGARFDRCRGMALDRDGLPVVVGDTGSTDFPTTYGAFDGSLGGPTDLFAIKMERDGSALVFSTLLGGSNQDETYGSSANVGDHVDVDASGFVYITGVTYSPDFPVTPGAFDTTHDPGPWQDVFVTKLIPDASGLVWSTFLGGAGSDYGHAIVADSQGFVFVTGQTTSQDFPTTRGAFDSQGLHRADRAYVTKFVPDGSALAYSTFLGGRRGFSWGYDIALTAAGEATVAGETTSSRFPVTPGAFDTTANGGADGFLSRLSVDGSTLVYSTYLGGAGEDAAYALALEGTGRACLVGFTRSLDFPVANALDGGLSGIEDGFVTTLQF